MKAEKVYRVKSQKAFRNFLIDFSNINRTDKKYQSQNSEFSDKLNIEFKIGNELTEKTELDKWLTERYALFQDTDDSINEFEIHHLEWPINDIDIQKLELNYSRFENLINEYPSKIHYSKGVKVLAWGKIKKLKTHYNKVYSQ